MFVSPLFDLTPFFTFADDKQVIETGSNLQALIINMEQKLELMTKWLRDTGLVVNEEKTEICLFYKRDHETVNVSINNKIVTSKKSINVLGVLFDCKLQWNIQVAQAIIKAKRALHGIKLIRKFVNKDEMKQLITSNFYSVLYYNCEIWLLPSLNTVLKQHILSASANALRLLHKKSDLRISYDQLHRMEKRALPNDLMQYKLSIQLYKVYNGDNMNDDWQDMNVQQNFNARNNLFQISDYSRLKVGKNVLANRLRILNNQIDLDWLNLSLNSFKIKMKNVFLK